MALHHASPFIQLGFYKLTNHDTNITQEFVYRTEPNVAFNLNNCSNCPRIITLIHSCNRYQNNLKELIGWKLYNEEDAYKNKNFSFYHNNIIAICILIIGLYVKRDRYLIESAMSSMKDTDISILEHIVHPKGIIDLYQIFDPKGVHDLMRAAERKYYAKYKVICFCINDTENIISNIQQHSAGMEIEAFRRIDVT